MKRQNVHLQSNLIRGAVTAAIVAVAGAFVFTMRSGPVVDGGTLTFTTEAAAAVTGGTQSEWDLANIDNRRVDYWVNRFTTDPKLAPRFATWLERKPTYQPMISRKLAERDMPQDLIYLAMIESGFNPTAYSHAHAGGLWQFIAETGRRYGLTIRRGLDERNQPEKATDAALAYLSDLHERFGSWYLAAAAYNTGENRVGRHMRNVTGRERGTDADYYRISHLLPRETREYVPMMIAAARISKEPDRYGSPLNALAQNDESTRAGD
jgi:membrane-bound lytic murein transglycosylase D